MIKYFFSSEHVIGIYRKLTIETTFSHPDNRKWLVTVCKEYSIFSYLPYPYPWVPKGKMSWAWSWLLTPLSTKVLRQRDNFFIYMHKNNQISVREKLISFKTKRYLPVITWLFLLHRSLPNYLPSLKCSLGSNKSTNFQNMFSFLWYYIKC
jgi:hypothetical protein